LKTNSEARKLAFFLPNTFTALNIGCGFVSVLMAFQGKFYFASVVILLGAIFDSVDGRVARFVGAQSHFGEEFDSISDVVTFGAAPAFLMYNKYLMHFGRLGSLVAFIFLLCGGLRLARFNANIDRIESNFFQGLPIPGAAIAMVGAVLISLVTPYPDRYPVFAIPYTLFYSMLMISNLPFNSFKDSDWIRRHKRLSLFVLILSLSLAVTYEEHMVLCLITIYVIGCLVYFFTHKELKDMFKWDENDQEVEATNEP